MKYKVVGEAKYEYEVEAENEDDALDRALEQFEDDVSAYTRGPADVLDWKATEV